MNMLLKQIYFSALVASLATPTEVYGQMPKRGVLGAVEKDKKTDTTLTPEQKEKFAQASIEDISDANFPEQIDSFDYPNAEITDVIKAISELTGKNFIIDPGVRGKITIIAPSQITVAEAWRAFLSALAINGYTVVPSGKFLKVKSARNAQRDSIETYSGAYFPNSDQMITRIIHLKHISAAQVNRDLRILPSKDGEMSVYEATNSIILSDYGANIERVMRIIQQLDIPGFDDLMEVVPIKFAKARDIADLIDKIINKGDSKKTGQAGTFTSAIPRFSRGSGGGTGQQGAASFMVIQDDRSNALIIVGNKAGIVKIKELIAKLDFRMRPEDSGGVTVYYVKFGEAEKIAQTLNGITKELAPKGGAGGGSSNVIPGLGGNLGSPQATEQIFGGDVKITADKNTNSLIITASKQDYEVILNLLSKIDIARDQVYVEAIIMEMAMEDSLNYGIGYYQYAKDGGGVGKVGYNGLGASTLAALMSPTGGSGTILGFSQGEKMSITMPTGVTTIGSLTGFINLLKGVGKANILSTPQIMALNNEEAEIEVGDKVPTSKSSSTANGVTSTGVNYENATIKLKIKPFISPASEKIRMEIDQKVKQLKPGDSTNLDTSPAVLTDRSIKTNIVVPNGDTAVLGGLMRDEEREVVNKVPLLGDIPILGWLFKSKQSNKSKTNLLVFITPKIIRNQTDQQGLLGKKIGQRTDFVKNNGGVDPYGTFLEKIQTNELNPPPTPPPPPTTPAPEQPINPIKDMAKPEEEPKADTPTSASAEPQEDQTSDQEPEPEEAEPTQPLQLEEPPPPPQAG